MDGFALSEPLGTGITTYSRNLAEALRGDGAALGVLYGRAVPRRLDPAEREVRFFDARTPRHRAILTRLWFLTRHLGGSPAWALGPSAMVETRVTSGHAYDRFSTDNVPRGAEVWNSDDMFGRANVRIALSDGLMPVRVSGAAPPAVMHWTHALPLRLVGTRNIYSIHDLLPLQLPWATLDRKATWLRTVRAIARTADHIVTVSEASRADIIRLLGVPPERVTNTYQPVVLDETPPPREMSAARLRNTYGLEDRGYFLFVSSIEPRKNVARLLDAFLGADLPRPLILVGQRHPHGDAEVRLLTEEGRTASRGGRVRHLGYLPRQDVVMLQRHARALCFPSLSEGFGLPVIEAMLLGTPVLTSTTTSLGEIAGDAALTVDPADTRAIAEGLRALDADEALRARLAEAGLRRAELFGMGPYRERLSALHARLGVGGA